jgi:hypothetical protein
MPEQLSPRSSFSELDLLSTHGGNVRVLEGIQQVSSHLSDLAHSRSVCVIERL